MAQEKTDFDKRASLWDADERRAKLASAVLTAIQKFVPLGLNMNVLELGAGTGLVTVGLAPIVHSVVAMDGSGGMLDVLKEKVDRLQLVNVHPLLADAEQKWPDFGPLHLVAGSMMLHHVKEVEGLFRKAFEALNPGGYLAMVDLDTEPGDFHDDNTGVHHFGFDHGHLETTLKHLGFAEITFHPVTTMTKGSPEAPRDYRLFLMTARKP